jgi:glycerophosphoryl diester phosphodiesterase
MFSRTPRFATELAQTAAMKAADWLVATLPETTVRRPAAAPPLQIIAHRGAWKERGCMENTFSAFNRARECGVWGIEFDVRFTKDDVAVVHHDETLLRTYGRPLSIGHITHKTLQHEAPDVPTLEDVLEEYAGSVHLMIEIKGRHAEFSGTRLKRIAELLNPLKIEEQFHLMSLEPTMLEVLADHVGFERRGLVSIATTNVQEVSDITLARGYKALTCHFTAMSKTLLHRHHSVRQMCGVGFAASKPSLHREWARGVDWLYTNYAHVAMDWLSEIEACERE